MIEASREQQEVPAASSLDDAHAGLVSQLVASLAGDRAVSEVRVPPADPAAAVSELERARGLGTVVLWSDADAVVTRAPEVVELLREIVERGQVVVVEIAIEPAVGSAVAGRPRDARKDAEAVCEVLPGAALLEARTVEVATLASEGGQPRLPAAGGARRAYLVCAGADAEVLRDAAEGLTVAAPGVAAPYVKALYEANLELRRANARLAREHLGRYDSAAATLLSRMDADLKDAHQQLAAVQAAHDALLPEHAELLRRIRMPHHRSMDRLAVSALRIPLLGVVMRARARRRGA